MIKILFIDVDGTLTDGQIYMGNNGEVFKSFHAHDCIGLWKLPENNIETVIITGRESELVNIRAKEMHITEVYQNISNKKKKIKEILKEKNISPNDAAYIGDDENDYDSMLICSYRGCPNNAVPKIKSIANFISNYDGGYGAVREYCEYILTINKESE